MPITFWAGLTWLLVWVARALAAALAAVAALLAEAGANIIEVSHQRTFSDLPAKATLLQLVIETRDSAHLDEVMAKLGASGLSARCT
jgi:threonine dehydratase